MKKVTALTLGVLLLTAGVSFSKEMLPAAQVQLVEVGNKLCPVSGEKVGEMGPAIKYEYNGKIYNLCCPSCKKDFKKDPKKFSRIAEDEVKAGEK